MQKKSFVSMNYVEWFKRKIEFLAAIDVDEVYFPNKEKVVFQNKKEFLSTMKYLKDKGEYEFNKVFKKGRYFLNNIKTKNSGLIKFSDISKTLTFNTGKGGKALRADEWEELICLCWNKYIDKKQKKIYNYLDSSKIYEFKDKFLLYEQYGLEICDSISETLPKIVMEHSGKGLDSTIISESWREFGVISKTPKTDIYMNDNFRLSLKKQGGSQLMSGNQKEVVATFNSSNKSLKKAQKKELDKLIEKIKNVFTNKNIDLIRLTGKSSIRDIKKHFLKNKKLNDTEKYILQLDYLHQEIETEIDKFLQNNLIIKKLFCSEAMTGEERFVDIPSKANYLFSFSGGGDSNINLIDDIYLEKIVKEVKLEVGFKTANARSCSSLRLLVK